jgi:hypothetical protein
MSLISVNECLKHLFSVFLLPTVGTVNQLISFSGRCEQSFGIEVEFHDQIAATQDSDSEY